MLSRSMRSRPAKARLEQGRNGPVRSASIYPLSHPLLIQRPPLFTFLQESCTEHGGSLPKTGGFHSRVRTLIVLLTGAMSVAPLVRTAAYAQLISSESFQYATGNITGKNGGTGWSGAWFNSPLNSTDNKIDTLGLSAPPQVVGAGNKNRQIGSDVRNFRYLDTTSAWLAPYLVKGTYGKTFGRDSTTIWISFLISCSSYPTLAYGGLHLMDGVGDVAIDPFGFKQLHQRFQFGADNTHANYIMSRVTNGLPGGATWQGHIAVNAQVRLLVHRIDFHAGVEEAWMWVDPPGSSAPDTSTADLHAQNITDFKFNAVNIGSGSSAKFSFDELRIGTTFQSVVPGAVSGVDEPAAPTPASYSLEQNYPNPFNPSTTIEYQVASGESRIRLGVFDVLGREIATLVDDRKTAGNYQIVWDASPLASGTYFYRLIATPADGSTPGYVETRKVVLAR